MKELNPKEFFDRAYSHLLAGEIKAAAECFEYVIENSHIYGSNTAKLAQQRILWYCVPLNIILAELEKQNYPIDIRSIIVGLFHSDNRYNEADFKPIIMAINDHLKRMPDCIHVGENFWMNKDGMDDLVNYTFTDVVSETIPVSLESIFRKRWPEFCLAHPSFPDHLSEVALATALKNFNIKVLANKLAVSEKLLPSTLDTFERMINLIGHPLYFKDQIPQLFPNLAASPELVLVLENYLSPHYDNRFIECSPGYYLTQLMLQFDKTSFDELFSNECLPISTTGLLKHQFPGLENIKLAQAIVTLVESQLPNNPHLVRISDGIWFSRVLFDVLHVQVVQALFDSDGVVSLDNLMKSVAPVNVDPSQLQEVILVGLRADNQVIEFTQTHWLHKAKINGLLDKAYSYLLEISQANNKKIVQAILSNVNLPAPAPVFYNIFENFLEKDPRFSCVPNNRREWRAIPQGLRDNDAIYSLLLESNFPLTEDQIAEKLQFSQLEYDLVSDPRFKSFPGTRWGLSTWIYLNDYIYKYLLRTGQHLHENVVVGLICKEQGFRKELAFFFPEEDFRFAQDNLNRWFCRYTLKPIDIDNLLAELDQYGGFGRKLDILFNKVLHLPPDLTNASEVLPSDHRFIHIDEIWYSRRITFRELSPIDVEKIYFYFSELPIDSPAISIKNVGLNALGWDGRLTNASDLLARDIRFVERHSGYWALSTWPTPDYERTTFGGIAVFGSSSNAETENGIPVELPPVLTKRGNRKETKSAPDIEQNRHYHTLSYLDVLHGNIRISGLLKKWIPETAETILLTDDESNELVAYVDETHTIFNIRDWIQKRGLTYGDKIYFQQESQLTNLYIRPYGGRDQRVFQEALQHQDIKKLIASARDVNMTYHDLMIDVMEAFGVHLHREDIFQLVDYRRTAVRNTIFEFLSLPDCPYEELRYFVPVGKGYWAFDRERKKAFDMKMKELLDENNSLKGQVALLTKQSKDEQEKSASLSNLKQDLQALEQSVRELVAEKSTLSERIQTLEIERDQIDKRCNLSEQGRSESAQLVSSLQKQITGLNSQLSELRGQLQQAKSAHEASLVQIDILTANRAQLQKELETQQAQAQTQITSLQNQLNALDAQLTDITGQLQVATDCMATEQAAKQTIQVQFDQTLQKAKDYHENANQEITALGSQIQVLTAQLAERSTLIQELESNLSLVRNEKTAIGNDFASEKAQMAQELSGLRTQLKSLEESNTQKTENLAVLSARLNTLDRALATPLGRLFARLQGLK